VSRKLTLKYFMWGYQPHFRVSLKTKAEDLFGSLSPKLIPEVFLIGKLTEDIPNFHPICPEPEDVCDIKIFDELDLAISEIAKADPRRNLHHSHPIAEENHQEGMRKRWLKEGVLKVLSESDSKGLFFGSFPQKVDKYEVVVILRFEREYYESYYSLKKDTVDGRFKIARSFIESCATEFLDAAAEVLCKKNPGANGGIDRPTDELMRSAAKSLMYTPASYGHNFDGLHGLYEAANAISLNRYEGTEAVGRLLVSRVDHPSIDTIVKFLNPAKLNRSRSIRKLLETSSESLALLTDSYFVYGLGIQKDDYDGTNEDLYEIRFTKRHSWSLVHDGNILMTIEDGSPQLPKEKISRTKILSDLGRIFPQNSKEQNKFVCDLIECASTQKHGTMLVLSNKAEAEAKRLGNQSTPIQPIKLTKDLIGNLTTIDGAILLSPDGICYAIGVVLDGMASPKGDPARGARFNSAIRYVAVNPDTLAVVISEDGTIDLVPNLRPQFPRSKIDAVIGEAKQKIAEESPDLGDVNALIQWLKDVSFYLLEEDCAIGNKLIEVRDKIPQELGEMRIVYSPFYKHEEMNESYYI